jgi:hypothetical protein
VRVVTAAGETIKAALPGAGAPNPYCASFKPGENNAEDPMSVGVYIRFGRFRTVHLGDLTKNTQTDGTFTVINARNGFAKTYRANGRPGTN